MSKWATAHARRYVRRSRSNGDSYITAITIKRGLSFTRPGSSHGLYEHLERRSQMPRCSGISFNAPQAKKQDASYPKSGTRANIVHASGTTQQIRRTGCNRPTSQWTSFLKLQRGHRYRSERIEYAGHQMRGVCARKSVSSYVRLSARASIGTHQYRKNTLSEQANFTKPTCNIALGAL